MSFTLAAFEREQFLAQKLGLTDFNAGVTTHEGRRERIRAAIVDGGLADAQCFNKGGTSVTYSEAWKSTYGTPLVTDELDLAISEGGR